MKCFVCGEEIGDTNPDVQGILDRGVKILKDRAKLMVHKETGQLMVKHLWEKHRLIYREAYSKSLTGSVQDKMKWKILRLGLKTVGIQNIEDEIEK